MYYQEDTTTGMETVDRKWTDNGQQRTVPMELMGILLKQNVSTAEWLYLYDLKFEICEKL